MGDSDRKSISLGTESKLTKQAAEAINQNNFSEGDELYQRVLSLNPENVEANYGLAKLAVRAGHIKKSLPFFKAAILAKPEQSKLWIDYIDSLILLNRGDDAGRVLKQVTKMGAYGNKFNELKKRIDQIKTGAINLNDPPHDLLKPVFKSFAQGQPEITLKKANKLMDKFPSSITLMNLCATLYIQLKNPSTAHKLFNKAIALSPNYSDSYFNLGNFLTGLHSIDEAKTNYKKAIQLNPNYIQAYQNLGNLYRTEKRFEDALMQYRKILEIKKDYSPAYNNIGLIFSEQGEVKDAIQNFRTASEIDPIAPGPHQNLGDILLKIGNYAEAVEQYRIVEKIAPNLPETLNNLGVALWRLGDLDASITSYKKAILSKPKEAEFYKNLGTVYLENGQLDAAKREYKKALAINPDFGEALWNLHGTATSIEEAKDILRSCVTKEPSHLRAKLTLAALNAYENTDLKFFSTRTEHQSHPFTRSFSWVFALPNRPKLFFNRWGFFDAVLETVDRNRPFYEYGVWRGVAFQYIMRNLKEGFGFDTFEGLPEDWHNEKAGTYTSQGNIPKIEGANFIKGKFEDTLPIFFSEPRAVASIINFDADLYSSTICALNHSESIIDEETVLIFDEFLTNDHWEEDEYRALNEFCENTNFSFVVTAVSFFTKQVAVKLVRK
jgi:tetratricopeptide (TPR) repeat protein